jgi:hypothetical protein
MTATSQKKLKRKSTLVIQVPAASVIGTEENGPGTTLATLSFTISSTTLIEGAMTLRT